MKKYKFILLPLFFLSSGSIWAQNQDCIDCIDDASGDAQLCDHFAWIEYYFAVQNCEDTYCWTCGAHANLCCNDYYLDFCEASAELEYDQDLAQCSDDYWYRVDNYCFCISCPCSQ